MEQKKFEDGVHVISNETYHSSHGVSRSALWMFKKNPYLYWWNYLNPYAVKDKPTPDMVLGTLVHALVLEPETFKDEFAVKPQLSKLPEALKLKDVGREAYDNNKAVRETMSQENDARMEQFKKDSENKIIIAQELHIQACAIAETLMQDSITNGLIDGSKREHSIYFTHEPTGIQCKVRPDAWLGTVVTDVKTTRDASYRAFQSDAYKGGYFLQAGMIYKALESIGSTLEKFVFACVEKKPPFLTANYVLDDEAIDYGVRLFDHLMAQFAECQEQDRWPAYQLQTLHLPNYANYED